MFSTYSRSMIVLPLTNARQGRKNSMCKVVVSCLFSYHVYASPLLLILSQCAVAMYPVILILASKESIEACPK
jgi:hypothetical protein